MDNGKCGGLRCNHCGEDQNEVDGKKERINRHTLFRHLAMEWNPSKNPQNPQCGIRMQ